MGGSRTEVIQPTPPAPVTAGQSAKEFAAALPDILAAQLEFQPQFDQATFDSFESLAPEFARVSQQVLQQFQPEQAALGEELAGIARQRATQGLTDEEESAFLDQFKSLVGNQVNAPIGASFVGRELLNQDLLAKQAGTNLGLSLSGKVPITQAFQNLSQFQVGNQFGQAFNTRTGGQNAFIAGSRPMLGRVGQPFSTQFADITGGIGGLLQGAGKAFNPAG